MLVIDGEGPKWVGKCVSFVQSEGPELIFSANGVWQISVQISH